MGSGASPVPWTPRTEFAVACAAWASTRPCFHDRSPTGDNPTSFHHLSLLTYPVLLSSCNPANLRSWNRRILTAAIMKLHYIGIIRNEEKPAHEIVAEKELSAYSRFTRNNYGEFMTLFAKTVAERTKPGQRQDVEEQDYTFHAYGRTEGVCGIIISDHQYPALVAHQLLSKVVDEFLSKHPRSSWQRGTPQLPMTELKDYIIKYQDPQQADSIMKIQKELDETKIVLHKTIESVLQRGEKIDDLVAKSDGLSSQSKMFYRKCTVLLPLNATDITWNADPFWV
ncbi:Longin [Moelleriella libera RCEF 2490]|uniref:Longin n=1 Tax=Moelleriella libera RCEF 2490 TaxID=1081109 RepID=A0A166NJH7_9HYPO|nr:Longin [Moelleriella libera RCEF 2490]